jgi:SHS2 domain-containing protein
MYRERADFERGAPYSAKPDGSIEIAAHHTFDEHRGEVRLRVEAGTLRAIFEEAARALCELTAGDCPRADERAPAVRVVLRAIDLDALFADWLNEVIYLSESRKEVFPDVHVEQVTDQDLIATLRGVEPSIIRTPVKAATMHDLHVGQDGSHWVASIVLDV